MTFLFRKVTCDNSVKVVFMNDNDPSDAYEAKAYPTIRGQASVHPSKKDIQGVALLRKESK